MSNLPDYVLAGATARGDHVALVDGATGGRVTYAELAAAVDHAAASLHRSGVAPGTTVALVGANHPDWVVAFYGALRAGCTVVPVSPVLTAREMAGILARSRSTVVIADAGAHAMAAVAAADQPLSLLPIASVAAGPRAGEGSDDGADVLPGERGPVSESAVTVDLEVTAVIALSSGTTGIPKAVKLSHRNLVATMAQHDGIYHVDVEDVVVAALPMCHIYGMSMILGYALRHGATVVTMARFDLARYLELVATYRATWLHVAPPLALALLSDAAEDADLSSVRHVVSGAAPLDSAVVQRLSDRLGCLVGQGYGMTEASPGVTWVPDDRSVPCPPGSVGLLVGGTEARLVDPLTGKDAPEQGELWVRGPQVTPGYLDDPTATADTVVDGEWLRTGDILRIDGDGVWWVVDRLKELIKYKGYQIAPAELEGVLLEHPAVTDAGVAGVPDPVAGELPTAWVAVSTPVTEDELLAWVAERVAPYKRVRAVHFVESVPRSPAGKILRRKLRELPGQ